MYYSIIRNASRACVTSLEFSAACRKVGDRLTFFSAAKGHYWFVREEALKLRDPMVLLEAWRLRRKLRLAMQQLAA